MDECMYVCNGWMYGLMDGWMYGLMDGWMYGLMDGWTHLCICIYVCTYNLCVDVSVYLCIREFK